MSLKEDPDKEAGSHNRPRLGSTRLVLVSRYWLPGNKHWVAPLIHSYFKQAHIV